MVMFDNGSGPIPATPSANVTAWTPGKRLANGKVAPCATGEKCDGIFNDTVEAIENGFGVGLLSPTSSGGLGIAGLAFGPVEAGEELIVKVSATDGLPKFASAADEGVEDTSYIVGKATLGTSATEEDVADANGVFHPSLAILLYSPDNQHVIDLLT